MDWRRRVARWRLADTTDSNSSTTHSGINRNASFSEFFRQNCFSHPRFGYVAETHGRTASSK